MNPSRNLRHLAVAAAAVMALPAPAALTFTNNPLYLISAKANVLITLDNSNSMDENADGSAVGSSAATSKSEIARSVIRGLTDAYLNRVNMGLMAYRQNAPAAWYLHNSPYDVSYNGALVANGGNYDPAWTGARNAATKSKQIPNPTSANNTINFNVNLPFYSAANEGTAFCYSTTANAFNNGENPLTGPWDTYRCFRTKTGTSNVIPTWGNGTSEANSGYASYIGQYLFSPTDSDYAQGILDFGKQMGWSYVSRAWYSNGSPGRGYLHTPIKPLDATQVAAIKAKLACNVPGAGSPCTNAGIQNAGLTPIEGTLLTAKDYFGGGWTTANEGYVAGCYPLPTSCGKNFVVLLTDGLPSNDRNGAVVSDPAAAVNAAAAAAAQLKAAGILTYVIGFALPYGTDPNSLNAVATSGGTDRSYTATDTASLQAAFNAIFDDIFKRQSSFGSISQNSAALNNGTRVYQGRFNSDGWSGELVALKPTGSTLTATWSTSDAGRIPAPADRKVFSYKPGIGGVAFSALADLTDTQKDLLRLPACGTALTGDACGQARIDWLRGDRSRETSATNGVFRKRTVTLGDIISSGPYYESDTGAIYVGANDGMLHAFDAATGNELFAYLPNAALPEVWRLTDPNYAHRYYVDGEIAVSTRAQTGGKNILVGALGRGGKALYALDVTQPSSFGATKVLWEFTDPDLGLVTGKPMIVKLNNGRVGVVLGNGYNSANDRAVLFVIDIETGALIRKFDTVVGDASTSNGMASPTGWDRNSNGTVDVLYAGDRLGNIWKIDVSSGSPSTWAFTLGTSTAPLPMFTALDASGNRQPITGGIDLGINPRRGDPNQGKLYVFFGTGQYLIASDPGSQSVQGWYGLIDDGTRINDGSTSLGRTMLKQRTILAEGTVTPTGTTTPVTVRAFSQYTAGDMVGKKGWYLDWLPPGATSGVGERITGETKFFGSQLIASTLVPSTDACTPGGSGMLNAIDPFTGASLSTPYFDANADNSFDASDMLTLGNGSKVAIGSIDLRVNLPGDAILTTGSGGRTGSTGTGGGGPEDIGKLCASGTSGQTGCTAVRPLTRGRLAWREIVRP